MMFLERLVKNVEQGVAHLGRRLWQPDARTQLRDDIVDASDDLVYRQKTLTRCRAEIETLRNRINESQAVVALLTGRIGLAVAQGAGDRAWRDALELDRARARLAQDQAALPKQEQLCQTLELQVRYLTRRLARLQDQLYRGV
jgi:uncharacterized coiled-coil protein SlyX